jgi:meso-butanediol dehydrogenase/(S,S)-butanediol dehydrogenase/diacetyl reductase
MRKRLEGKVAIVTGGAAGIGAAVGKVFCAEGAQVILVDRDGEAAQKTAAALRAAVSGAQVDSIAADVASLEQCAAAVRHAVGTFGKLDTLINNAGIRTRVALADAEPAQWQGILEVNLLGAVNCFKASLPELRRAGSASVVNVSSVYAVMGRRDMGLYDATKAALLALTRTMAFEEAGHGIRANAVLPGSTLTDFHLAKGRSRDEVRSDSLLKRWGTPEEIALPILWLASDEASFVTGSSLIVDGGLAIM